MYSDIPFWLSLVYMLGGFFLLAWSSDRFIDSAAVVARALGISPFIIGILVIGFGTLYAFCATRQLLFTTVKSSDTVVELL